MLRKRAYPFWSRFLPDFDLARLRHSNSCCSLWDVAQPGESRCIGSLHCIAFTPTVSLAAGWWVAAGVSMGTGTQRREGCAILGARPAPWRIAAFVFTLCCAAHVAAGGAIAAPAVAAGNTSYSTCWVGDSDCPPCPAGHTESFDTIIWVGKRVYTYPCHTRRTRRARSKRHSLYGRCLGAACRSWGLGALARWGSSVPRWRRRRVCFAAHRA